MSGNTYYQPPPLAQPPPQAFQPISTNIHWNASPPPRGALVPSQGHFQPLPGPPTPAYQLPVSPGPVAQPQNISLTEEQRYPQPRAQQLPSGHVIFPYNQAPLNGPPTPAYTPSLYGQPSSNLQNLSGPATQYFPPPPQGPSNQLQQPVQNNSQTIYYPPPPQQAPNQLQQPVQNNPEPVYYPPPPQQQSNKLQQPVQTNQQPVYYPPPPQQPSNQLSQVVQNHPEPVYNPPPANAPPTPAYETSYGNPVQSPQNAYFSKKPDPEEIQSPCSPPPSYSQAIQTLNVQHTYGQTSSYPEPNPVPSQVPIPSPYSTVGQPSQNFYPAEKQQYQQWPPQSFPQSPQYPPMGQLQDFGTAITQPAQGINPAFQLPPIPSPSGATPTPAEDEQKSSKTKRFFADTLVGRVARSGVSTVSSAVKLPACLSPWGDNNPVTLPNVRYRDAVLFGTFAVIGGPLVDGASNVVTDTLGADSFISEIVSSGAGFITGNCIVKYGVFQIVEQAIDKGILEHVLPEVERTMRTTSITTLQVAIKHKLMGVDADIRFLGTYPTTNLTGCDKGWFCPYLFASGRTPVVPRSQDFAIAQFFGPYLKADTALTHKLLSASGPVLPLCDPDPTHQLPHARLLLLFTGIAPFRAGMWSTSRRPGCGQLFFHLLDGCPALVLPVSATNTPILAWSPWTLSQMHHSDVSGYSAERQHGQICEWVAQLVERQCLYPSVRDVPGAFERISGKVVSMIINAALTAPKGADDKVLGKVDPERAGIVMLRF